MLQQIIHEISLLDWLALGWFLACWIGYGTLTERGSVVNYGLVGRSHGYRLEWARRLLARENRIVDASLVGNLMTSVSFYANTTMYIIAGLMAAWGALDKVISAAAELPFARIAGRELWEIKLLLLIAVFVFSYFKFTWALRQFNLFSIFIGAAPAPGGDLEEREIFAKRMASMNSLAGDEFNRGIRAYYFGLSALAWFVHPVLFLAVTTLIVAVLYRRDFASHTLATLK